MKNDKLYVLDNETALHYASEKGSVEIVQALLGTGFGLDANIVEEYILLAALLHVFVALKLTWDISVNYTIASGKLNLAISGITLLTFMCIHLFQFRFGETHNFKLCPPPHFVILGTLSSTASTCSGWTHRAAPPQRCGTSTAWSSNYSSPWAGWCSTCRRSRSSPLTCASDGRRWSRRQPSRSLSTPFEGYPHWLCHDRFHFPDLR